MKKEKNTEPIKKKSTPSHPKKAVIRPISDRATCIQTAILQERERIGMDLHDGIIQALYGIGLNLQNTRMHLGENQQATDERLNQATQALDGAIRNIRAYILNLRPRQL